MLIFGLLDVPLWLIFMILILIALYWLGTWNHDYHKKQGIPGPRPYPFVGTLYTFFMEDFYTLDICNKQRYGKVAGFFSGNAPELVVFDEDMLSEVTIKQFHNFTARRDNILKEPRFEDSLFNLHGGRWKASRSQMSPTFTTGKLRKGGQLPMSEEINRSAKSFADRLRQTSGKEFETKKFAEAYTMDCIASTAFGIRIDSQKHESNDFNVHGKKFVDFNFKSVKFFLSFLLPKTLLDLTTLVGYSFSIFNQEGLGFFVNVFNKAFESREEIDTRRVDFLQLMMNAQRGEDIRDKEDADNQDADYRDLQAFQKGMTKDEILANALLFFLAGYDTVSIGLTQLLYCLACNQECQDKVLEEVDQVIGAQEDISYDVLMQMKYLSQCINETLRIYPPAVRMDRKAMCDTEVCGIKVAKGTIINLPILGLHHDPELWNDPEKFDPERFSSENKGAIRPTQYMPFGIGPRNCIGMRQALFEIKAGAVHLLKTHRVMTCDNTEIPLTMAKEKVMRSENGVWLTVKER